LHIRQHRISTKEYYLTFLKKEGDGICKFCGKPTNLIGINGYATVCSKSCLYKYLSTDKTINNKRSQSMLKIWKDPNSLLNSKERNKKLSKSLTGKKFGKERIKKLSIGHIGQIPWNKNKPGCFSTTSLKKMSNSQKKSRLDPNSYWHSKSYEILKEEIRQVMLNGRAIKMLKMVKKISKPEIALRNMIKELYSDCEFQYGVFNYALDIAIVKEKIAIEYDGYFHFDTEEHIQYYRMRQEQIENEGWTFYHVTMFDKLLNKEKVKKKIEKLKKKKKQK